MLAKYVIIPNNIPANKTMVLLLYTRIRECVGVCVGMLIMTRMATGRAKFRHLLIAALS